MEIVAFILLGLIAMLFIVPPLIRGKLASSPLASAQSFQRSMHEMGTSLEPYPNEQPSGERAYHEDRRYSGRNIWHGRPARPPRRRPRHLSHGEVRRRRFMALLMFITFVWAIATLASRARWCLIIFAVMAFLSLAYLALSVLVPRASAAGSHNRHLDEIALPPKRQAM